MNSITKNVSGFPAAFAVLLLVIAVLFSVRSVSASEITGGDMGGDGGWYGSADIFPDSYGSADIYPDYYGSADIYPDYYGSADIYPEYYGSADIFPSDYYGSADIFPSDYYGSADIFPGYETVPEYTYTDYGYIDYVDSGYVDSYGGYSGYGGGFSMPSFGGMTIVPPRYTTPSYPTQPTQPTRPTQTQAQTQTQTTPINIVNTNTNTNVNTNVSTVSPATPGPIVQYVYPQTTTYPVYYPSYYQNYPNYYNYNQAPYCTITVSQQGYQGGTAWLSWSSSGATSAYISPIVGQVAPNGSTSVYAYGNNVYSLTVTGPGGSYTCRTQSYIAPASPYVSLTQIPYTGLAMGPIGNAMYWMSLILLAVAGAYLLVYYKGGALALATSIVSRSQSNEAEEAPVHAEEVKTSHIELPTENPSLTRDAMKIVRSLDGTPRLVISRA